MSTGADAGFTVLGQTGQAELVVGSFSSGRRPGYPGYFKLTSTVSFEAGTPPVTITLPRPVQFTVHVTDQSDQPLAGATITTDAYLSNDRDTGRRGGRPLHVLAQFSRHDR